MIRQRLEWQALTREQLADHLRQVEIIEAAAIGDAHLVHAQAQEGERAGESIVISLPDGSGLLVTPAQRHVSVLERRRPRSSSHPDADSDH